MIRERGSKKVKSLQNGGGGNKNECVRSKY
jgi:hypothetical protein